MEKLIYGLLMTMLALLAAWGVIDPPIDFEPHERIILCMVGIFFLVFGIFYLHLWISDRKST
ncbi:hypothetical protein ACFL3E_00910 [Patescibacteria group bacterium]